MPREVAAYDYRDETGSLLFQAVRFEPKDFRQRAPATDGGWTWSLAGVRRVLYRLPELMSQPKRVVIVVEGEKDADRLFSAGFLATCNPMGAGKWQSEYSKSLVGRTVIVIPDNDQPGKDHAAAVGESLAPCASKVAILPLFGLPEKGDVSDWLDQGHTADELKELCRQAMIKKPNAVEDIVCLAAALPHADRLEVVRQILAGLQTQPAGYSAGSH